jgi:hypothetical protein
VTRPVFFSVKCANVTAATKTAWAGNLPILHTGTFLGFFEEDAQFWFGSAPAVMGKDAIRDAVDGFFASIKGLRHEILETWFDAGTIIC